MFFPAPFPFPGRIGAPLIAAALAAGAILYSVASGLEDGTIDEKVIYAYVDGKPVKSYIITE